MKYHINLRYKGMAGVSQFPDLKVLQGCEVDASEF